MDITAAIKSEVELGAVLDSKPLHTQIGAHEELYCLHHEFRMMFI